jgi:hypothetical protein
MSQIIIDQDDRATSHADSFEDLIAEVADVPSLAYMASQRAMRARMLLTGPIEVRLASLWIDAFIAGAKFAQAKRSLEPPAGFEP